jgi:hypothetical protein
MGSVADTAAQVDPPIGTAVRETGATVDRLGGDLIVVDARR